VRDAGQRGGDANERSSFVPGISPGTNVPPISTGRPIPVAHQVKMRVVALYKWSFF
jgi:hypothetical protein